MPSSSIRVFRVSAALGVAAIALLPGLAAAQEASEAAQPTESEIVVTGTLIRGTVPVGSNVIAVGQERVQSTGAATSNELLAAIPQVTNYFNRVPAADLSIAVNQIQVSRPNLRNISPSNAAASATLILVDGHRVASVGIKQASIDPDLIPTGAIERVEVVTEGGSATYGADAVAGVINFITRKRFDGLQADARYGFADDYWQWDASVTAGKDWGSGSAYVSYTYTKNDALFGRERDFIRGLNYATEAYVPLGRECDLANVAINTTFMGFPIPGGSVNYAYPNLAPNTFNACDTTDDATTVPEAERHGVMAGLYQELDDTTSVDIRAYYGRRETLALEPMTGTVNVGAGNPYFRRPPGVNPPPPGLGQAQAVSFSFAPVLGRESAPSTTLTEQWGANAELRKKLGDNWQVRGLFNYSHSYSAFSLVGPNAARLVAAGVGTTTATAINPYDIAATVNRALIADIADNEIAGDAKDDLLNLRAVVDGSLLALPGGEVRLAFGYEYMNDSYKQRYQTDIRRGTIDTFPWGRYDRNVHSVFGELQIPVFGTDNATAGFDTLLISAQGRYDHYSDFGDTFNPKLGVTWKPVDWLSLRGNWGTSFVAPSPLDQLGSQRNTLDSFPFVAFTRPGDVLPGGITCCITLALQGSRPNLQPQTADTWSVGFDIDPPFVEGLHASASYYKVVFKDILATPTPNVGIFTNFPDNVTTSLTGLTPAQLDALRGLAPNANATIDALPVGRPVYQLVDFRTGNFGILRVSGIDFALNYRRDTGFGSVDFGVNGNYQLKRESQVTDTSPVVNDFTNGAGTSRLSLQSMIGANIGSFRAQATWNHSGGYDIAPTASTPVQDHVGSFDTINLFFKYDVPSESGILRDLSFTLNVNNVFDQDPPVLLRNDQNENGYANGFTLGRLFILGVSKKF